MNPPQNVHYEPGHN